MVATPYSYINTVEAKSATLCLRSANVQSPKGHVAVWEGVSNIEPTKWIQLGIVKYQKGSAFVYVEVNDGDTYSLRHLGNIRIGPNACIKAAVQEVGDTYTMSLNGVEVDDASVTIHKAFFMASGETYGHATMTQSIS